MLHSTLISLVVFCAAVSAQDFVPLKPNQVPCLAWDRCGVCAGDNACVDCADVPHGTAVRDANGNCVQPDTAAVAVTASSASPLALSSAAFLAAVALL